MNNRQRMYSSNRKAREHITHKMGGSHVYFKEHLRRKSKFYNQWGAGDPEYYQATVFFNLFDGLCFISGCLCFFQVKTNAWPARKRIDEFYNGKNGFGVFAINVRTKGKKNLKVRWYTDHFDLGVIG